MNIIDNIYWGSFGSAMTVGEREQESVVVVAAFVVALSCCCLVVPPRALFSND
jgi:hypothetical protein